MRYTLQSRKNIVQQITTDAVAILINAPIYGGTTPNLSQLQALDAITMQDIVKIDEFGIGKSLQHHLVCGSTRSNSKHPASIQIGQVVN